MVAVFQPGLLMNAVLRAVGAPHDIWVSNLVSAVLDTVKQYTPQKRDGCAASALAACLHATGVS